MGNPYVKLLSLVDPNKASAEFHQLRGGTAATNITYNAANTTSPQVSGGITTVSLSDEMVNTINQLGTYIPVLLAIVALNALSVVLLVLGALVYVYRRRNRTRARRTPPGRTMSTMPMTAATTSSFSMGSPAGGEGDPHGTYQPVSMALTDDPFVPPSPAFQRDGAPMRPMSVA